MEQKALQLLTEVEKRTGLHLHTGQAGPLITIRNSGGYKTPEGQP